MCKLEASGKKMTYFPLSSQQIKNAISREDQ
jgi:hypothetical protein